VALAVAAAVVLQLGSEVVVAPLASRIWPGPQNVSHLLEPPRLLGGKRSPLCSLSDVCRVRRRAILRGYFYPRSRYLRTLKRRLLSRHDLRRNPLRLGSLL